MKFSNSVIISLATLLASVQAEDLIVALKEDIDANIQQYLSYIATLTNAEVSDMLSLYRAAQTYTDDSYTTLVDSAERAAISNFVTGLPWYSSRIAGNLDIPEETSSSNGGGATSSPVVTSTEAESSSAPSTEAESSETESSEAESTTVTSTEAESTSEKPETSSSITEYTGGADMAVVVPGAGFALVLGAVALL